MAKLVKTRGMSSVGFRQSARWEKKHETKALARNQRRREDKMAVLDYRSRSSNE